MNAQDIFNIEVWPGTKYAKKITCKLCGEKIYEVGDNPSQAELDCEAVGVGAHLEFRHNMTLTVVKCDDPQCLWDHQSDKR